MAPAENENQSSLAAAQLKKAQAEADLAKENAAKAKLEREKIALENAEWGEGKKVRQQVAAADALAKQMANETTRRSWIADAVPDLSQVDVGSIEGTDKPLFTAALASRALNEAAAQVAKQLFGDEPAGGNVFLTTDHSLVERLAAYNGVKNEIEVAAGLIDAALGSSPFHEKSEHSSAGVEEVGPDPTKDFRELMPFATASAVAGAAAAALPGVLSLFSAKRTLASAEVAQDAYITMVAVAGALLARKNPPAVIMDEPRLLPGETEIGNAFAKLHEQSLQLAASIELARGIDKADVVDWSAKASATLSAVQTVIETLTKVDEKTRTSALTRAASQEVLIDPALGHIVVVTPAGSGTTQLINDRPLWWKDTVSIMATAAIAFVCVDPQTGYVKNAGVSTGSSQLNGKIGEKIDFDAEHTHAD